MMDGHLSSVESAKYGSRHQRVPVKSAARQLLFKDQQALGNKHSTSLGTSKAQRRQENVGVPLTDSTKRHLVTSRKYTSSVSSLESFDLDNLSDFSSYSSKSFRSHHNGFESGVKSLRKSEQYQHEEDTQSPTYQSLSNRHWHEPSRLIENHDLNTRLNLSSPNEINSIGSHSLATSPHHLQDVGTRDHRVHDVSTRDRLQRRLPYNEGFILRRDLKEWNQNDGRLLASSSQAVDRLSTDSRRGSYFHKDFKRRNERVHQVDLQERQHYWMMKQENAPALSSSLPMTLKDLLDDDQVTRNPDDHHPGGDSFHYSSSRSVLKSMQERDSWNDTDSFLPDYSYRLQSLLVDDIDTSSLQTPRQSPSPRSKLKHLLYRTDDNDDINSSHVLLSPNSSPTGYVARRTSPRRTASLLWVFKLLDILHCVPADQQHQLITKAYWLRRWQAYVRKVKGERLQLLEQQQRAIHFHNGQVKGRVLRAWLKVSGDKKSKADKLLAYHLKTKGLRAMRHYVKRTKLDEVKADNFNSSFILKSCFAKWRTKYHCKRQQHLKVVFQKWEQAKLEKERCRIIQQHNIQQTQRKFFKRWREQYETNNKERIATLYYKVGLLSRYFAFWRTVVQHKRVSHQATVKAVCFHGLTIKEKLMKEWRVQTSKSLLAKRHYSLQVLRKVFFGLKRAVQVSRVERLEDNSKALEVKRSSLCRHCLATWRRALLLKQFQKEMERKQIRRAFQIWCLKLQRCHIQTRLVSALGSKSLLMRYFTMWCRKVKEAHQRQIHANNSIAFIRTKIVFQKWLHFTKRNSKLREKLQEFHNFKETQCKQKVLTRWKSIHTKRQTWSLTCVKNACNTWISLVKQRKVEQILNQSQDRIENRLLKVYFHSWLCAKKRIDLNSQRALTAKKCLNRNLLHQILLDWRLKARRSKVIAPMRLRKDKKLLCRVFTAWTAWSATRSERKQKLVRIQQHRLAIIFNNWRCQVDLLVKEKKAKEKLLERRIHQVIDGWRAVVTRRKQQSEFLQSSRQQLMMHLFMTWKDKCERLEMNREIERGNEVREYIVKLTTVRNWRRAIQRQQLQDAESCERLQQLQECNRRKTALTVWRRQLKCQVLAREMSEELRTRHLHRILITWHQYTCQELQQSLTRFSMAVLSQCLLEDTVEGQSSSVLTSDLAYQSSPEGCWNKSPLDGFFNLPSKISQGQLVTEPVDMVDGSDGRLEEPHLLSVEQLQNRSVVQRLRSQSWSSSQQPWVSTTTSGQRSYGDSAIVDRSRIYSTFSEQGPLSSRTFCNERGDGYSLGGNSASWSWDEDSGRCYTPSSIPFGSLSDTEDSIPNLPIEAYTVVRLKKMILHWKHWPVSVAFKQWLKYTQDRKQLSMSKDRLQQRCNQLQKRAVFPYWLQQTNLMRQARVHYNVALMSSCLHKLVRYKLQRHKKQEDTARAHDFSQRSQLVNCFDRWRVKSLENQKITGVMDTWKEYMGWSDDAERKVQVMKDKLQRATVKECLYIWRIKLKQLKMVDQYRNGVLTRRFLLGWSNQSTQQVISRNKMEQFRKQKLLKKAFTKWKIELRICNVTTYNIQRRQKDLLRVVLQRWHNHSKMMSHLGTLASKVHQSCSDHNKRAFFQLWKHRTNKMKEATNVFRVNILGRCLVGWHQAVQKSTEQAVSLQRLRSNSLSTVLRENFVIWKQRTENERKLRDLLKNKQDSRVKEAMETWKDVLKLRKANRQHRLGVLRKTFSFWKEWLLFEKQNKQRLRNVVSHWRMKVKRTKQLEVCVVTLENARDSSIQQRGFVIWKEATKKQKIAVAHCRCMAMKRNLKAWLNFTKHNQDTKQKLADFKKIKLQGKVWRLWRQRLEEEYMVKNTRKTLEQKRVRRIINAWIMQTRKQKELASRRQEVNKLLSDMKLKRAFKTWKEASEKIAVMKRQAESAAFIGLMKLREKTFFDWKHATLTQRAVRYDERRLMKSVFLSWKMLYKEEREQKRHDKDLQELADWHYQRRLSRVLFKTWSYEVKIERFIRKRNKQLLKLTLTTWTKRTSQSLMAKQIVEYKLYSRFWKQWRTALVTSRVMRSMDDKNNSQVSSQVFSSWQRLSSLHHYGNQLKRHNSQEVLKTSFSKWREVFNSLSSSSNSSPSLPTDNNSSCSSELAAIWELQ